ncbi:MAG: alpha/beta hydrolase [Salinisphaera sp.]|nr:alpha/beta hydrolase [Salinisphaera sp.]
MAVWILSGEYDCSAPPTAGRALADAIDGAHFVEMQGIGHFPMSEHPDRFKEYALPVLLQAADLVDA